MELALEEIRAMLLNRPQGQALQARQGAENNRQFFFARREALQEQLATELPPLAHDVEQARLELEAAQAVVKQKRDTYEQAYAAHLQTSTHPLICHFR